MASTSTCARREFSAHDTYLTVVAVFSGVSISVPEGVEVRMTGAAVFGAKAANVPAAPPGAPVLHIRCTAIFSGVEAKLKVPFGTGWRPSGRDPSAQAARTASSAPRAVDLRRPPLE